MVVQPGGLFFGPNGRISSHFPLVLSHGSWLDNTAGGMMGRREE